MPPVCVLLQPSGEASTVLISQWDASSLFGGNATFVGAVDELEVFAVADRGLQTDEQRRNEEGAEVNPYCSDPCRFDAPVFGAVLFVRTGPRGGERDVDKAALLRTLRVQER